MIKKAWMTLLLIVLAGLALRIGHAEPEFMNRFNTTYPNSLLINNCMVCHTTTPPDEDNVNRYGQDFDRNDNNFRTIEPLDSDRDGYSNIAEINAGTLPGDPLSNPGSLTNGDALYGTYCAGCHNPLATSNKKGRTATQIQTAINNNVGGMGGLTSLTPTQVQAVATALGQQTPPSPPPPTTDGPTLYSQNCASCHGPLASSTKIGRSASQIQDAILNNIGSMGYLNTLTSVQIDAIAAALSTGAPVLTTVNVTPATASILLGTTQSLTASALDQNGQAFSGATITWSSSNSAVATVNATTGLVTGVSAGTATITATATSGATTRTGTSVITVTTVAPPPPQPPAVDLTIWSGQWLKVTMKYQGYFFGNSNSGVSQATQGQNGSGNMPAMSNDHESITAYLKFVSWDPNQRVLQAEIHQKDPQTGQWVSDPLALNLIGGTSTDFLCWTQVNGGFTAGFVVRIQGKEKGSILKSGTIKTLGGYYFGTSGGSPSDSPASLAGAISISGSLVPEAKVPVPK